MHSPPENSMICAICDTSFSSVLYENGQNVSITSLSELVRVPLKVYYCELCTHLQTPMLDNIESYYDTGYNLLVESDEEDQVYQIADGKPVFRVQHQVQTLLKKLQLPSQSRILDYGCAKAATLKALCHWRPDIQPYAFDVSSTYISFWEKFIPQSQWATYHDKPDWAGTMDIVTSFFSMEHVVSPQQTLETIRNYLKPEGLFYAVFPNVATHFADFVVVDHVHHYTESSIQFLLSRAGFDCVELDDTAHEGAWVLTAKKRAERQFQDVQLSGVQRNTTKTVIDTICQYWRSLDQKIEAFEATIPGSEQSAIYGAGFWGAYIASRLNNLSQLTCFVDQNPYLLGKQKMNKPILTPDALPADIQHVFVGLKSHVAEKIIDEISAFKHRPLRYFFT